MHRIDAHFLQIAQTGGNLSGSAVKRRSVFCEREEFPAMCIGNTGGCGNRKVPDVDFPDNGVGALVPQNVGILIPAFRIGLIQIYDHRPIPVDTGSLRINIAGLFGYAAIRNQICIIHILIVTLQGN